MISCQKYAGTGRLLGRRFREFACRIHKCSPFEILVRSVQRA